MEIRLRPDLEELIKQDIQRGPYHSIDEFVEHAISLLHEQEAWLAENRAKIEAKINEGYAAARRGELIEADDVRSRLNTLKQARFREQQQE